jgi:hypothetical protein
MTEKNIIDEIANKIYQKHLEVTKEQSNLKALESQRNAALKASKNLISAIEQGIVTEQTKERLKELETQISQYEFDIEQEKQRNYVYLTPVKIKQFLESAMKGDPNLVSVRKTIVRFLIREVIIDNERLIITYNFTANNLPKKAIPDNIDEIAETAKAVVDNSSNVLDSVPPRNVSQNDLRFFYIILIKTRFVWLKLFGTMESHQKICKLDRFMPSFLMNMAEQC